MTIARVKRRLMEKGILGSGDNNDGRAFWLMSLLQRTADKRKISRFLKSNGEFLDVLNIAGKGANQ